VSNRVLRIKNFLQKLWYYNFPLEEMMNITYLDNKTLLKETHSSSLKEKKACLELLDYLVEVEKRAAYVELGYSSLYSYVTECLGYSQDQSYLRINAVRIMTKIPEVKKSLESNQLTLSTLANATTIVSATQDKEDKIELSKAVEMVTGKTKEQAREIINQVKEITPVKKQEKRKLVLSLTEEEYELVQETLKLKNQEASKYVVEKCRQDQNKFKKSKSTQNSNSRNIPVSVRRNVLTRAKYKCEYVGCTCTKNLELAHIVAFSKGGVRTENNLKLLCRAHHKFETFEEFGQRL
jgi:5-methylcytosine-specific restriction endonuclease McrA